MLQHSNIANKLMREARSRLTSFDIRANLVCMKSKRIQKRARRSTDARDREKTKPTRRSARWVTSKLLVLSGQLRKGLLLERTLNSVTQAAEDLTNSDQASLRLLDDSGKRLLTSARSGPSVHRRGAAPFQVGEGFIGWVVVHRQNATVNNPIRDPRFVSRNDQVWTPSAVMAVPLITGKKCIGVLSTARRKARPYRQRDMEFLMLVAHLSEPYLEIARLKRLNESDPLTLLHNRRHLQHRLPQEIQKSHRKLDPLAVAMLDLDKFKKINDTYGHDVGDEVLTELANRLNWASRSTDVVARWGGEEFLVILPKTSLEQAYIIAERLRKAVSLKPFSTTAGPLALTISIGVAQLEEDDDDMSIQRRVDEALYKAKRAGRNRVFKARRRRGRKKIDS